MPVTTSRTTSVDSGGYWFPMPWVPMAATGRAFGFQWSTAVYWSMRGRYIAIRSQDARRPDGSQNLPYKRMGPENHLRIPTFFWFADVKVGWIFFVKLGPSSPHGMNGSNCLKTWRVSPWNHPTDNDQTLTSWTCLWPKLWISIFLSILDRYFCFNKMKFAWELR